MLIGTPQYMSPEQARGLEVGLQTDLFSFGAVLYELLSGTAPFAASTTSDVIVAVLTREPPRLTDVPTAVANIVGRALHKDRTQRYATAAELLVDLTNAKHSLASDASRAMPVARQPADNAILDRMVDMRRQHYVPAICLARVYSRLGNTTAAIEWLEAAFAERNGEMVFLELEIAGAADDDPLRRLADEPRVEALLDAMHLPNRV
jgi:hypothetical protein